MALVKFNDEYITIDGKAWNLPIADGADSILPDVLDAIDKKHTHSNKDILDSISQTTITDISDLKSKSHTHTGTNRGIIYRNSSAASGGSSTSSNASIASDGNIQTQKLYVGSASYGYSLPSTGVEGQVFFKISD